MLPPALAELRIPKPVLAAGVAVLLVGVGLCVLVPRLLDGSRQGQAVAAQLAESTGQRVRIEGPVEVALWPHPHITINSLKLIAVTGGTTVLAAPKVELNVTWASLLAGNLNVTDIKLVHPAITLTSQQSGAWPNLSALSLSKITVEEGSIDIARTSNPERISSINGTLYLPAATTLVRADITGDWRSAPIHLALDLGPPMGNIGSVGYLKLDVGAAEATIALTGKLDLTSGRGAIDAQIDTTASNAGSLWALFSSLGVLPDAPIDAGLRQPLVFSANLKGDLAAYDLSGINFKLGNWNAGGLARYVTGAQGGLSVALKSDVVDLSLWPTAVDWLQRGTASVSPNWLGAFDLQLAGVTLGNFKAAPVLLKGDVSNGVINFSDSTAMLPGDGRLQFAGHLTTVPDTPTQLEGKLNLESIHLRETLAGLGVSLPESLDDTALRQLKLTADVRGPWRAWGVPNLDVTLDGIHVTGQMAARSEGGTYDTSLNVDQFDLDKYAQAQTLPAWLWQLPPANLSVVFKQLRAGGRQASNVTLTAAIEPNLLTIKSLDAADFGGNTVRLSGSLSPDAAQDSDLTLRVTTQDFAQLRQSFAPTARLVPKVVGNQLSGPVDLTVRYRRAHGESQQLSSAALGDGRIDLVVTDKPEQPTTFKIRLQNRETARVLRQLLPDALLRADAVLGLLDFYAEGTKQPNGTWQLSALQGQIAGMGIKGGSLVVAPTTPVSINGSLVVANANIDLWRQTVNPASIMGRIAANIDLTADRMIVAGENLDKVTGQVRLSAPAKLSFSNLTGAWQGGKATLTGEASLVSPYSFKGSVDVKEANVTLNGGSRFGIGGVLDLGLRADAEGGSWNELLHSLNGDGEFSMDSGTFKGIDFAELTEGLQDRRSHNNDVDTLLAKGGESVLSSLGGDFTIEEGIVRGPGLRLRTPSASAEVKADLDLSAPRLDSQSAVTLRELADAPPFNLSLSGPLTALVPSFDAAALSQHVQPSAPAATPDKPAATTAAAPKPATPAVTKPPITATDDAPPTLNGVASEPSAITGDAIAVLPPEEPVPPSADGDATGPVAIPVANPAELAAQSEGAKPPADKPAATATAPHQRPNINRRRASAAPAAQAAAPSIATIPAEEKEGDAPPSIQELLQAMPALQDSAQTAVSSASQPVVTSDEDKPSAAAAVPNGATRNAPNPRITFAPAPTETAPRTNGVAPEFAGESPVPVRSSTTAKPARDVKSDGLTIRLPPEDPVGVINEDDGTSGQAPASSVGDLMGRIQGQ